MTDLGSQTTTRLNAWGWTLTLAHVGLGTLACMALGAFLGVAFGGIFAANNNELMRHDTLPGTSDFLEPLRVLLYLYIGVHIGGAIGILVGLVASTLACRRWLVPRLKLRPKFRLPPLARSTTETAAEVQPFGRLRPCSWHVNSWNGCQITVTGLLSESMAFSSRRFPIKHQGQITSEITSTEMLIGFVRELDCIFVTASCSIRTTSS